MTDLQNHRSAHGGCPAPGFSERTPDASMPTHTALKAPRSLMGRTVSDPLRTYWENDPSPSFWKWDRRVARRSPCCATSKRNIHWRSRRPLFGAPWSAVRAKWRALNGSLARQSSSAGRRTAGIHASQSDFTHADVAGVMIAGQPFGTLLYHFVMVLQRWEHCWASFLVGKAFTALAENLQQAYGAWWRCRQNHGTDSLSAAVPQLTTDSARRTSPSAMMPFVGHYGIGRRPATTVVRPTRTVAG